MDSDIEFSDDEVFDSDHNFFDCPPFPTECQTEVESSEAFYKCFIRRYHACPAFFMGSLQDACESAFNSSIIKERRPILVYIHHDKSLLSNIFCSNIFCSEIMIDYLIENYIVWPWDITYQSNKNMLMDIWKNLSTQFSTDFSMEKCPMLIGIMRRSAEDKDWLSPIEYECTLLHQSDTLTCNEMKSSHERLFNELIRFKEKCDDNEKLLSFDFCKATGLPLEIFLEITKYLYLNEIIYAFTFNILPFLNKYNAKLHLSDPTKEFSNMVLRKSNPEHIVSVRLKTHYSEQMIDFTSSAMFTNIISLTLVNVPETDQIKECKKCFPNLIHLSFWYDYEVDYQVIINIFRELLNPIKRFEIHCRKAVCTSYCIGLSHSNNIPRRTIEYFLLDASRFNSNSMDSSFQDKDSSVIIRTIDIIKYMVNIRYVHLMINNSDLKRFLDRNKWKHLVNESYQLRKIKLQVTGNMLEDNELTQKVQKMQKELRKIRENIKFQVIYK